MRKTLLTVETFTADDFVVTDGVMLGEPLSFADELVLDDVFQLSARAIMVPLDLISEDGALRRQSKDGNDMHLDCCLTLMAPDSSTEEVLILVEVSDAHVAGVFALPLGELKPQTDYRLVGVERHIATQRFAEAASGSFARGTHISMGDGSFRPVETLSVGDMVLTRDAGQQPIRWIGQATVRAVGGFAPVVITTGALNNDNDLVLRPDHRLFIYQRQDQVGAGRAEVLIKARHLVDEQTVIRKRGGFIEYFQLVFDEHHIIFAEGIAAESHLIDPRTRKALPDGAAPTDHAHPRHLDYEVQANLIKPAEAAALLRKASIG